MDAISRDEISALTGKQPGPCVSIFLPVHPSAGPGRQDSIEFKNLLHEAREQLLACGLDDAEASAFLEPAVQRFEDGLWRRHQSRGLAMFLSAGAFRDYDLPIDVERLVVVAQRFHIQPLLPLLHDQDQFYILALSQNEVTLLRATHYSVSAVDLQQAPKSLAEALKNEEPQKQLQFHSFASSSGSPRIAIFHGQGARVDFKKDMILRYFRQIDEALHRTLRNEQGPLVLAGDENLFPIYREVNTYPHLLDEGIAGNPERSSHEDLRENAWEIVQPYFAKKREEDALHYRQLVSSNRASNALEKVVQAAFAGRVERLFLALGSRQWGTFDAQTDIVTVHEVRAPGDDDLVDYAAAETLRHGGVVYAVEPDKMPDAGPIAAIFRYYRPSPKSL